MLQKILHVFFSMWLLFLGSCTDNHYFKEWAEETSRIRVLSTTAMIGDLVQEIGGERIHHLTLIRGELDPHSYELVKGDDEKLQRAHMIFYNGLGLEHGASLSYWLHNNAKAISVGDAIEERVPEEILRVDGVKDPHIWMDISLWKEAIVPIEEALSSHDPAFCDYFHENANKLRKKMDLHHQKIQKIILEIPKEKRYLVTSHDAFNYFARGYLSEENGDWKEHFQAPEGLAPEGQLSLLDIQKIMDHVKKHHIQTIFAESNISQDSVRKIAESANRQGFFVSIAPDVLYGDSMGGANYFDMMQHNANTLKEYLR